MAYIDPETVQSPKVRVSGVKFSMTRALYRLAGLSPSWNGIRVKRSAFDGMGTLRFRDRLGVISAEDLVQIENAVLLQLSIKR